MKAVSMVLKEMPEFNSSLDFTDQNLVLKNYYHIGIAVDTPNGLTVPVVRDVDKKSIFELSEDLMDLSSRARDKKLKPDEMKGGTFTISSLGGIGGTAFSPIVNPPEVAIMGVSRSTWKQVFDKASGDFETRFIMPFSLSYDHRVIDGAAAATFTSRFAKILSDLSNFKN
jgi:pyruvate dehydrogenase E2 component (dihydrolipoamide acetyltransferase)